MVSVPARDYQCSLARLNIWPIVASVGIKCPFGSSAMRVLAGIGRKAGSSPVQAPSVHTGCTWTGGSERDPSKSARVIQMACNQMRQFAVLDSVGLGQRRRSLRPLIGSADRNRGTTKLRALIGTEPNKPPLRLPHRSPNSCDSFSVFVRTRISTGYDGLPSKPASIPLANWF